MRNSVRLFCLIGAVLAVGCQSLPAYRDNPATVVNPQYPQVWDKTVCVIEKYFDIAYENRYDGRIETEPMTGATLLEPWRPDAADLDERLEATLQSIRRRAVVLVQPAPTGGWAITVEVYKELEYTGGQSFDTFGPAALITSIEPTTESIVSSPITPARGWISLGRDLKLEAKIIEELQRSIDCGAPPA